MVSKGNRQIETESRSEDGAKEKQNVGRGKAGRAGRGRAGRGRVGQGRAEGRTGVGEGQSGVDYRCWLQKKRSHVMVLLHTRQGSGLLVKKIDRQSELPSGI